MEMLWARIWYSNARPRFIPLARRDNWRDYATLGRGKRVAYGGLACMSLGW